MQGVAGSVGGHGRRPRRSLKQIAAAIKPANYRRRHRELGGDPPVGKEQ
ncbi:MAG TPA: hypothetical protein VK324_02475 [Tepidisphaeraceae bacterium]|nr:hypothetical protein [Tepidisphaeraceae bacterium]